MVIFGNRPNFTRVLRVSQLYRAFYLRAYISIFYTPASLQAYSVICMVIPGNI